MRIVFSETRWLWPCVAAFGGLLAVLAWSYLRRSSAPPAVRVTAFALKVIGLAALFLCLLEPLGAKSRSKPGDNLFACVVDDSKSMRVAKRGELLRAAFAPKPGATADWQAQLSEQFGVRRYVFDARLQPVSGFDHLAFAGRFSSLGASLKRIGERFHGQPLAGILLFTDGNATDLANSLPELTGLPPIYPVMIGGDEVVRDLAVEKVTVSQTAFEDAPVTIDAAIRATGYGSSAVEVKLTDASGKVIASETPQARGGGESTAVRFNVRPEKSGVSFYKVEATPAENEATIENNQRLVAVNRESEPHRFLYVAGRPNWEYKFLQRALADDTQLKLTGLIRVAKREPKFDWRARSGESSNPLYRGFGATDDAEQYDQPVLVRLSTRDENELRGGFPKTPEELYPYHAVVIDDLEAQFFSREQMRLLQRFVSERGGSVMMLGGQESFREGAYAKTPLGEMLPVYLEGEMPARVPGNLRLALTREGWLEPWARLRTQEDEEKKRLAEMPPFRVLNTAKEVKPGANVVARVSDEQGQEFPALVVQRFGDGRTAALLIGDMWRWGLRDADSRRDMDKAWRQLARWLVADVPARLGLKVAPSPNAPDQSVVLTVRVRDKVFQPVENAPIHLTVQTPSGKSVELSTEPDRETPGSYRATFSSSEEGGYTAQATMPGETDPLRADAGWTVSPDNAEYQSLQINRALLEKIAKETGGEIVALNGLEQFVKTLPNRKMPVMETYTEPLWNRPSMFLFALACFIGEWGLRRWKGLP